MGKELIDINERLDRIRSACIGTIDFVYDKKLLSKVLNDISVIRKHVEKQEEEIKQLTKR